MNRYSEKELGINDIDHYQRKSGLKTLRMVYKNSDFIDYVLMIILTTISAQKFYDGNHKLLSTIKLLSVFMITSFGYRNGIKLKLPSVLDHPKEIIYSIYYKIQNTHLPTLASLIIMLLESHIVDITPEKLDHHYSNILRNISVAGFYLHLSLITSYRTIVLIDHLIKKNLVSKILTNSKFNKVFSKKNNVILEIFHAYLTGIMSHLMSVAPWYYVITTFRRSALLYPFYLFFERSYSSWWLSTNNDWYYRDHWLSHHSEIDFIYFHGPHHDAIPSGLLGVDESGFLESFLKNIFGHSFTYFSPLCGAKLLTKSIYTNINNHQYIPGVFPYSRCNVNNGHHHMQHHYLNLKPIGIAFENIDIAPISVQFDTKINKFNPRTKLWEWFVKTTNNYEPRSNLSETRNDSSLILKCQFIASFVFLFIELLDLSDAQKYEANFLTILFSTASFLYFSLSNFKKAHSDFFKTPNIKLYKPTSTESTERALKSPGQLGVSAINNQNVR